MLVLQWPAHADSAQGSGLGARAPRCAGVGRRRAQARVRARPALLALCAWLCLQMSSGILAFQAVPPPRPTAPAPPDPAAPADPARSGGQGSAAAGTPRRSRRSTPSRSRRSTRRSTARASSAPFATCASLKVTIDNIEGTVRPTATTARVSCRVHADPHAQGGNETKQHRDAGDAAAQAGGGMADRRIRTMRTAGALAVAILLASAPARARADRFEPQLVVAPARAHPARDQAADADDTGALPFGTLQPVRGRRSSQNPAVAVVDGFNKLMVRAALDVPDRLLVGRLQLRVRPHARHVSPREHQLRPALRRTRRDDRPRTHQRRLQLPALELRPLRGQQSRRRAASSSTCGTRSAARRVARRCRRSSASSSSPTARCSIRSSRET